LLVRPRPSSDAKESGAVKPMLEVKASASSIIGDAEQVRVTMEVTSHDQVEGTDATVAGVFSIAVNQGRYFLDIGIAAVVIPGGSRRVQAETIPGTGDRIAHVDQDWRVDGALMINAFVFGGRRVSGIWYRGENDPSSRGLFGAQVGFNLDLKNPLDQIYLGLFIEPIAGLSLGAGVALVNGQFLTGATGGGTLLAPGAQPQVETNRMLRPYLAITFSSEIIDSAKNVFTTARNAGHE